MTRCNNQCTSFCYQEDQYNKKKFIREGEKPKLKHSALRNTYILGGLKDLNIFYKIISGQCSWLRRLFNENCHEWKIIALYLI